MVSSVVEQVLVFAESIAPLLDVCEMGLVEQAVEDGSCERMDYGMAIDSLLFRARKERDVSAETCMVAPVPAGDGRIC